MQKIVWTINLIQPSSIAHKANPIFECSLIHFRFLTVIFYTLEVTRGLLLNLVATLLTKALQKLIEFTRLRYDVLLVIWSRLKLEFEPNTFLVWVKPTDS